MNPAAEPYSSRGILVRLGASSAALQLFGPQPRAASGAWFSVRSLVKKGVPGSTKLLWYAKVGLASARAIKSLLTLSATPFANLGYLFLIYSATEFVCSSIDFFNNAYCLLEVRGMKLGPGPRPPLPALTTTGFLDAVPKPEVAFCPAASWLTALVKFASVLSSFVSWFERATPLLLDAPGALCFC